MTGIIKGYQPVKAPNPYAADIAQMELGDAYQVEGNLSGGRGSLTGEKAKFQDAAREAGYSAREDTNAATADTEKDHGTAILVLRPRVTRGESAAEATEE